MYLKAENGTIVQYPYPLSLLPIDYPNTLLPANLTDQVLAELNVFRVVVTSPPNHNALTQSADPGMPVYNAAQGYWEQSWAIRAATSAEIAARKQAIQASIVQQTQQRLDDFAKTRNYDGILSACSYATSTNEKFGTEGQHCVAARDATWAKLYEMLAEVEAGTRPVPAGYADVEPELPILAWPNP